MRWNLAARLRSVRPGLMAAALAVATATVGRAQVNPIIFDGNIVWNNGATGTTNFVGAAAAGSPCLPGLDSTTTDIATVQFTHNSIVNPLLPDLATSFANPSWQPGPGSPAYAGNPGHGLTVEVPDDGFFEPVCWVGAVGPRDDWTQGWTYYGLDGSGRSFPVRPLVVIANQNLYSDRTFSADSNYLVQGQLRVKSQATLTIEPGTWIFEEKLTAGTVIVERGANLVAQGTAAAPIVITSDQAPGSQSPGGGGGLFVHGYAKVNAANSCIGDSAASEGGAVGYYGGNDDADDSGVLSYVRVEFAGVNVGPNNEANSFTFNGVGSGTQLDHLQAHRGLDDLFEFFGGTARAKYLVGTYGDDDVYDWQMGFRGRTQFVVGALLAIQAGAERGIEADNNEFSNDTEVCSGRSNPSLSNFTLLGDRRTGTGFAGAKTGAHLRRGTGGALLNSIIADWKLGGFEINGAATFANHCTDRPFVTAPGIQCSANTAGVGGDARSTFAAHGHPNPFRNDVAIRFALTERDRVRVDLYTVDGRLVATLADREFEAGQHALSWSPAGSVPAGVYFYDVRTNRGAAKGRLVRVD